DAARRDAVADGPGLVGAVDAEQGILVALPQIERAGAERIAQAARHTDAAAQLAHVPHQLGLARQHLPGRIPVRPFLLVVNVRGAGPAETLASDADAVAHRPAPTLDEIEIMTGRIDHDRDGRLAGRIGHGLAQARR